jgi:hypothetical protein
MSSPVGNEGGTNKTVDELTLEGLIPSFSAVTGLVSKLPFSCLTAVVIIAAPLS